MRPVADGIWQADGFPAHSVNAFLVEDVLFDCRTRWDSGHILRQLRGYGVSLLALTHAHPDHWGAAPAICAALDIPLACHEADAGVVDGSRRPSGEGRTLRLGRLTLEHGRCTNVRRLNDGDNVGAFRVIHAPGHSDGHVVYFREADGVAVIGDLFNTMAIWTRRLRLGQPPPHLSVDAAENRRSIRRLLELAPSLVLPGHGPPLRDMNLLREFAAALPQDP
jgi:glyoxylase-like metal-dependent hydrolase (beta-lactamase superfamily II)